MKNNWIYYIMTIMLVICFIILCVVLAQTVSAEEPDGPIWTKKMEWAHKTADEARALGYSDDSEIIQALTKLWWQEWEDMHIIAKTVYHEANPAHCEHDHSLAVAVVILNRVASPYFKNTVKDVVASPGQYVEWYTHDFDNIPQNCLAVAKEAMDGDHEIPSDVLWQAEFPQGTGIWKIFNVDTGYFKSRTYICRGIMGVG